MRLASADLHAARVQRVRAGLEARHLDGLLVTNLQNVAYLTGLFASAAAAIVTRERTLVITDGRYDEALQARARDWTALTPMILPQGTSYDEVIVRELRPLEGLRIGFEDGHVSVRRLRGLEAAERSGPFPELLPAPDVIENLRVVKDAWELHLLRDAAGRLSDVAKCILPRALAGTTERELAGEIEAAMRGVGFDRPAFDTIVASGPSSALPHYRAGDRRIAPGDMVVMDFGGVLDGYAVDMTRTVVAGTADARARAVIEAVAEAHRAAIAAVRRSGCASSRCREN